jgi:DNA-binding GntR family transcriptional regulator
MQLEPAAGRQAESKAGADASLSTQAHQALIAALRDGQIRSGAFLSMPVLVDLLGLPIAAVREAVKLAEAGGLVTVLPKRGVVVMDAGPEMTRECLELRAILDSEGARRLIETGAPLPLARLREEHERLRDAALTEVTPGLQRRATLTDLSLHDALAAGVGLRLAQRIYDDNRNRVAIIQNQRPFLADRIVSAMEEHLTIITALEQRDAEAAVAAIRQHLAHTLRWWGV